jgi:hypothetical protein
MLDRRSQSAGLNSSFNIWKVQDLNLGTKRGDRNSDLWWLFSVNSGEMLEQCFISQNK